MELRLRSRLTTRVPINGAEDARWSVISSVHDQKTHGCDELISVALNAAQRARTFDLSAVAGRCSPRQAAWVHTWPGENYRLLAALADTLRPATILEIGTYQGHGALALATGNPSSRVVTYDIVSWTKIEGAILEEADLAPVGRIEQRLGDLDDEAFRSSQLPTLVEADLIFIDGPKDGQWRSRT
jgi:predicted O-methyltransferase YrrM